MTAPDASAVAALLREFGQRSALHGGNPFRAKVYARAAESLLALSLPLDQIVAQGRLRQIPGIGDESACECYSVIRERIDGGSVSGVRDTQSDAPA
jgi:DNA polymerase (family 10)